MIELKQPQMEKAGATLRERVDYLYNYLFEHVGELNNALSGLEAGAFEVTATGTANDIAAGTAPRTAASNMDISMNGHRIRGLPMPERPNDAASVEYVQQVLAGRKA